MSDARESRNLADTVGIVGVGLIGGSIAAGLKRRGFSGRIVGIGRNAERLAAARDNGLLDELTTALAAGARDCDLLVFCTPVDRIADGVREAAEAARPGTLITDAGSIKAVICRELSTGLSPGVTFIGSHPLAGSEKTGFEHADAELYAGRLCVVTPQPGAPPAAKERLTHFWRLLGMRVVEMAPHEHDRALARTSHLPHVAASALARLLDEELQPLAASGFRDTTRIAAGDPDLWVGILLQNAGEVVDAIDEFAGRLDEFRSAIVERDAARLKNLLGAAKRNRDALNEAGR